MKKLLILLLFCSAGLASADNWLVNGTVHFFQSGTSAFWNYQDSHLAWEGPAIVGATSLASFIAYKTNDEPLGKATDASHFRNTSDVVSNVGFYTPLALPVLFFSTAYLFPNGNPHRSDLTLTAEELAESLGFSFLSAGALKLIAGRTRPNGSSRSFPSAHSAMAFSAAGVLAQRYPWYVGAPSMAAATAVAASRLDLHVHYFSDVIAGAGLGMLFATSVHLFHEHRTGAGKSSSQLVPAISPGNFGVQWNARF